MLFNDYLVRGDLAEIDPDVADLINLEAERQKRCLILVPSESSVPWAVRQALSSPFHNIYAEGYPPEETRLMSEAEILDIDMRLADYRRYADPRYYKGVEFADIVESLARRRGAELFAATTNGRLSANDLFVNVQPLSGAPANSAVYTALLTPGDTILGMNLLHGGHLTHGSPAARSGKQYRALFYGVDPETELLDYEGARQIALREKPKIIIGGYSSYPWAVDWLRLRRIADECGALLMADIAHVAGLVIAGAYPSPIGIADVVTFTTHKSLDGPRGAVILTHHADLAKKLDRGVFPGEQGGPHVNAIAALAVAFKLAARPDFTELQHQTVRNAMHLAAKLAENGIRLAYGGTNTHLLNIDCESIKGADGTALSGDMAARILDLVGIVCNRNTLPRDDSAARPSGVRLGTPWVTQRGFREPEIERLAEIIAKVLKAARPFSYDGKGGKADARAKIDYGTLYMARCDVAELCDRIGIDYQLPVLGAKMPERGREHLSLRTAAGGGAQTIEIRGRNAGRFLRCALTSAVYPLSVGASEPTKVLQTDGSTLGAGIVERVAEDTYHLHLNSGGLGVASWLQALSDGFVIHDEADLYGKIPGPVVIRVLPLQKHIAHDAGEAAINAAKDYFVGAGKVAGGAALPKFAWAEPEGEPLKRTSLYDLHKELGAKMVPFAGYEMPVWYRGVSQEHAAVRTAAGLFDVSHMGVWEISGPGAEHFLNGLTTNDVSTLEPGEAHYSYLLDVDGVPLDDIYVYRLGRERFMLVVNASNDAKDQAWARAVHAGQVMIDPARPGAKLLDDPAQVTIRDLRDPAYGPDRRVDLALQGPKSLDILLSLSASEDQKRKIKGLAWSTVTEATLAGHRLVVSRTGYTGERIAYELFVNPDEAPALFKTLVSAGATPCGLASRDSTRTEAGLPLYGHELGYVREYAFTPGDAGFASYVKLWKPFFVGKAAYTARELKRDSVITRFRMDNKGIRPPQPGAAALDKRGRVIGVVTSCSIDSEGYQTGQVYLKAEFATEGTPVLIVNSPIRAAEGLKVGDKVTVPDTATVLTKFPGKKK